MRVAVFSDIHGNLPALEATLADIDRQGISQSYCLGDLVNYAPFPNEVIELVRSRAIPTILGNHDEDVALGRDESSGGYRDPAERERKDRALAWTRDRITPANLAFLQSLPQEIRLTLGNRQFLLVHASPRRITEYLSIDLPFADFRQIAAQADADVIMFGHTHSPFLLTVSGVRFVSVGSIGSPGDGNPQGCYAIVDDSGEAGGISLRRVAYDIAAIASAIRRSELSDAFADLVETGGVGPPPSPAHEL